MYTDSFQTSMIRFFGGRPRFLLNILSREKVVNGELGIACVEFVDVKMSLLLPLKAVGLSTTLDDAGGGD